MVTSELKSKPAKVVLKKAASIFTAVGFFAAAAFLVTTLWTPTQAASAGPAVSLETAMLLTVDKPQPPAPKLHLPPPSEADGENEMAALPTPELVTELNSWTYTQSSAINQLFFMYVAQGRQNIPIFNLYAKILFYEAQFMYSFLSGFHNPFLTPYLNFLQSIENRLSPYSAHH